ncbi:class I SAM-dependent methyltransferase [Hylemonella gracilis]|nr:class I SAM-dependent methyltransferase [Hylemonella gracilis]
MPRLTEADLPALYSQYYPRRNIDFDLLEKESALVGKKHARFKRWLAGTDNQGHYLAKPGQRVLDIGSGSCLSLLELRQLGVEPFGVEADPNVAVIAQRYGLNVHIGSIHDDPFPGQVFDLITLNQVIEHVPDPAALLRVVRDRLAPGGRIVLSFPNVSSWQRRLSGTRWINWHAPYHQHHFSRRSFALLARQQGYEVVNARSITPNLWTLLQLRAIGRAPDVGVASNAWQSGRAPGAGRPSFARRLKNALLRRLRTVVGGLLVVVNRIVDRLGAGDSLLVVLKKTADGH